MSNETMFSLLDSVSDDDLIQVIPAFDLGRATDGKWFARKSQIGGLVSVTAPVNPDTGEPNLIIDPSPGTNTFTIDLNDEINVYQIIGLVGNGLEMHGFAPDDTHPNGGPVSLFPAGGLNTDGVNAGRGGGSTVLGGQGGNVQTGDGNGGLAGTVSITALSGGSNLAGIGNGGDGGDIVIDISNATGGLGHGGGTNGRHGQVFITGLPTADPGLPGAIWIDVGAGRVIKVSP